jgi:hypothetical protein
LHPSASRDIDEPLNRYNDHIAVNREDVWMMLFVIILPSKAAEFSSQVYVARQELAESTTFRDYTFRGCDSNLVGGALFLAENINLIVPGCHFANCWAESDGAIFVQMCASIAITKTASLDCFAGSQFAFFITYVSSGRFNFSESSVTRCTTPVVTFGFQCSGASRVEFLNSSVNYAVAISSGFAAFENSALTLRFSTISMNRSANCMYFVSVTDSNISCLVYVYNHVNELVGLFTKSDGSVAVHFSTSSSLGRVAISADIDCECEYFAIDWPDCICPEFVISTLPSEAFTGSNTPSSGNGLTLSNRQDACLFYLSSSWITSWGNYSTDEGYDYLQFGEVRMVRKFTGTGSFTRTSQNFAKLWWHSDEIVVSTSFSVRMTSGEPGERVQRQKAIEVLFDAHVR